MKFSELTRFFELKKVPFALLGSLETGRVLVIEEGARVLALTAPGSDQNAFWCHPQVAACRNRDELSRVGSGGMGGLRLWQAPEQSFMWKGKPDSAAFSNYQIQEAADPGCYSLEQTSQNRCVLQGEVRLTDYCSGKSIGLEIRRILELFPLPDTHKTPGANGLLLRMQNTLRLTSGNADARADLWHLMQLPAPAKIGAFVTEGTKPQIYFNPGMAGGWISEKGIFSWTTNGQRMSKLGLSSGAVTRGLFATRNLGPQLGVYLWSIPISQSAAYVDSPPGETRNDQAVQFWDGFGFCEVEYHSPGVSPENPEIFDTSELVYLEINHNQTHPLDAIAKLSAL